MSMQTEQNDDARRADGFETLAIHAGQEPDPLTGAVVPPIYQVSTFKQDGVGGLRGGYEYSRSANPTRRALEECLAALEGGVAALAFASGMAASDCVVRATCRPGDRVLIPHDAYGGTFRLFDKVFAGWGVGYEPVPMSDLAAVRAALRSGADGTSGSGAGPVKLVWVETPTNPLLSIANTSAPPSLHQPLPLGADIVVHSSTKYLGGHSDIIGGAVIVTDADLAQSLAFLQNATGAVAGPFDAGLTLRGIKTLGGRRDRHSATAPRPGEVLAGHPALAQVYYPGLESHPGHE